MLIAFGALVLGLVLLVWSADRFVEGASATASHFGMPPLLIGMVIVGFGTSAPELVVSLIASVQGNPGLALGNAYGSNITNIALILGITALMGPIAVQSQIIRRELPILLLITLLSAGLLWDLDLSRLDAAILMVVFSSLMGWTIFQGIRTRGDNLGIEMAEELERQTLSLKWGIAWTGIGLLFLIASSRLLVWGAVEIATSLGVPDLIIGLTVVAVGTSLPELASSVIAARRGEFDIALGNVIGSNMFNTLAVVGIAGLVHPLKVSSELLFRDVGVMTLLTVVLFVFSYGFRGPGRINRVEGAVLLAAYVGYTSYLIHQLVL